MIEMDEKGKIQNFFIDKSSVYTISSNSQQNLWRFIILYQMFQSFLKYSLFFHVFIYLYWKHFVICFRHYNQGTFHVVCKSKKTPKKQ